MTGPLGPYCVVLGSAVRPPVLSADSRGDLLESRPQWTAVSFVVSDVRQDVLACWPVVSAFSRVVRTQDHESDTAHELKCLQSVEISTTVSEEGLTDSVSNTKRRSALVAKL